MPNPKEKVKRSNYKHDLDMLDAQEASEIEIQHVGSDQFGVYLNEYALAKKASFVPSELGNTESIMTPDQRKRIEFGNMFEAELQRNQLDPTKKVIKKQNTILESFYTEGMDFYDLDEEAKAIDTLDDPNFGQKPA